MIENMVARDGVDPPTPGLFRASVFRTINDLQVHVRPLSTCKVVDDTMNADWNCGLGRHRFVTEPDLY